MLLRDELSVKILLFWRKYFASLLDIFKMIASIVFCNFTVIRLGILKIYFAIVLLKFFNLWMEVFHQFWRILDISTLNICGCTILSSLFLKHILDPTASSFSYPLCWIFHFFVFVLLYRYFIQSISHSTNFLYICLIHS